MCFFPTWNSLSVLKSLPNIKVYLLTVVPGQAFLVIPVLFLTLPVPDLVQSAACSKFCSYLDYSSRFRFCTAFSCLTRPVTSTLLCALILYCPIGNDIGCSSSPLQYHVRFPCLLRAFSLVLSYLDLAAPKKQRAPPKAKVGC